MNLETLKNKLDEFHKSKCNKLLGFRDNIIGGGFHGDFNVSGFHEEILNLVKEENSFWGVDKCLRIEETADAFHSYLFSMGIFAESINLNCEFSEPIKDKRFRDFQTKIINQFFEMVEWIGLNPEEMEATYLGGATLGNNLQGRDKILKRKYIFPLDKLSEMLLIEKGIKSFPVKSLANIDINPIDGALVGPRIEIFYKGIEIATIVFDCFRIEKNVLVPMNYVGGYAIGIERIFALLNNKQSLLDCFDNYRTVIKKISVDYPAINSAQFKSERFALAYGLEATTKLNSIGSLSDGQKKKIQVLKKALRESCSKLGVKIDYLDILI